MLTAPDRPYNGVVAQSAMAQENLRFHIVREQDSGAIECCRRQDGRMQEIATAPGGSDAMIDFFLGLQVHGTPEKCYETIVATQKRIGNDRFVCAFSYAGMPLEESERNMRLFARDVMPELQSYDV